MESLTGLVVCGGKSSRMGLDKSQLEYHGVPQKYFLYNLLKEFCSSVYLSINDSQIEGIESSYQFIVDETEYSGIGPMSALLSAWKKFPDKSWLAIGCDYPFIDKEIIQMLTDKRKRNATCFQLNEDLNEPLITIYESSFYPQVMNSYLKHKYSLSRLLTGEDIYSVKPPSADFLKNVNTMREFFEAKDLLNPQISES